MGFSLLVSQDHIPVSYDGGFLIWPFMSRRAARKVEFPEVRLLFVLFVCLFVATLSEFGLLFLD